MLFWQHSGSSLWAMLLTGSLAVIVFHAFTRPLCPYLSVKHIGNALGEQPPCKTCPSFSYCHERILARAACHTQRVPALAVHLEAVEAQTGCLTSNVRRLVWCLARPRSAPLWRACLEATRRPPPAEQPESLGASPPTLTWLLAWHPGIPAGIKGLNWVHPAPCRLLGAQERWACSLRVPFGRPSPPLGCHQGGACADGLASYSAGQDAEAF